MQEKKKKIVIVYPFCYFRALDLPHPANVTPLNSLCLFAGSKLSRMLGIMTMLLCIIVSDIGLAYLKGYPVFGIWSLFTYSGFLAIILLGSKLSQGPRIYKLVLYVLGSTLGFWLWTNLGSWLLSPSYVKSFGGLISCYIAGLPFLRNSLLGNLEWMVVIFGLYHAIWGYIRNIGKFDQVLSDRSKV